MKTQNKKYFFLSIFFFCFFPLLSQEIENIDNEYVDGEYIEDLMEDENILEKGDNENSTTHFNFVKSSLLFGFHIPDEEYNEGYNFSVNIANSINKYTFFTFDLNIGRFYTMNTGRKRHIIKEVSIGVGIFFNFLRYQNNTTYLGIEFGSYHTKNTYDLNLYTKSARNNLMIAWVLGNSYSITEDVSLEGLIRLKANHLRNLSINLGVGYKIIK